MSELGERMPEPMEPESGDDASKLPEDYTPEQKAMARGLIDRSTNPEKAAAWEQLRGQYRAKAEQLIEQRKNLIPNGSAFEAEVMKLSQAKNINMALARQELTQRAQEAKELINSGNYQDAVDELARDLFEQDWKKRPTS